jgi:hypothetical protein
MILPHFTTLSLCIGIAVRTLRSPDRRRYRCELVVGKIDRRHGLSASQPLSSKKLDPALHGGLIAVRHVHHPDHY